MKTVLITGSSRGIGKSIAIKFASNGYNIVLNYLNNYNKTLETLSYIKDKYSVNAIMIKADVSKENEVRSMFDEVVKTFDSIDCVINNAAIAIDTTLEDKTVDNFKKVLDTNLIGSFLISKHFGKYMYDNKMGNIINITSTDAIDTYYPEGMDYDASKAGLISLTKNFAVLYAPYVRVNAIASGWVETDMNKDMDIEYKKKEEEKILLKRFASPEEIANVAFFLASEHASYINSSIIRVDGGK